MALKPIPRLIIIMAVIGGAGYGVSQYMKSQPTANSTQEQPLAPAPVGLAPVQNAPVQQIEPTAPVAVPAQASADNAYQTIVNKGLVRVSVQSPSKPFYSTQGGAASGFNVDFLKLLFAQSEFTKVHSEIVIDTDHEVDTYAQVPEQLLKKDNRGNSTVDIAIDGLTFADGDLNGVMYSLPYVEDFGYSLITGQNMNVRVASDLRGMNIGILQGDPDVEAYVEKNFPGSKIIALSDASTNGQRTWINDAIKSGKVSAVVYDYPFAVAEIAGTDLQFAIAKLRDSDIKYKIAVRSADTQLLQNLNLAIRKVKENPQYGELIKKYFMSGNTASVRSAQGSELIHVVVRGETLASIANATLGNSMRYGEIEQRNNLANPNLIQVGQRLVIPK